MQNITFTIAAQERKSYTLGGRFIMVKASDFPVDITLYNNQGGITDTMFGAQGGDFVNQQFVEFSVFNGNFLPVQVTLTIADNGAGSNQITGEVRVKDTALTKIMQQSGVIGVDQRSVVAKAPIICIKAEPTKQLVIRTAAIGGASGQDVYFGWCTGIPTADALNGLFLQNKYSPGPQSQHRFYTGSAAIAIPTLVELPGWVAMGRIKSPAFQQVPIPMTQPLVLQANAGFAIVGAVGQEVSLFIDGEQIG